MVEKKDSIMSCNSYPYIRYMMFICILAASIIFAKSHVEEKDKTDTPPKASNNEFNSPAQLKILEFAKNYTDQEKTYIHEIKTAISPLKNKLRYHPVYSKMATTENVVKFMNTHVYCVWDFMNLVKRLQQHFTSISLPWRPAVSDDMRYFARLANEIILEEETDELDATFISHFWYYVESIRHLQGNLSEHLTQFISDVSNTDNTYEQMISKSYIQQAVKNFLDTTKHSATHERILAVAASFTYGREVLLPEIFTQILTENKMAEKPEFSKFVNYLDRHIHLDGEYHGYLAEKMVVSMIENDEDLKLVISEATKSLNARLSLWDHLSQAMDPKEISNGNQFNSPAQLKVLEFAKNYTDQEKTYIHEIKTAISPLKNKLRYHPVYSKMSTTENVIKFMNTHVYCVWDFMNLVKRLQQHFTSLSLPWRPAVSDDTRYFARLANEIILEEETDELDATFISHFWYYVESIRHLQGNLSDHLTQFISDVSNTDNTYEQMISKSYIQQAVKNFLDTTKHSATHERILAVAASFTYGREVLLPEIFTQILTENKMAEKPEFSKFVNYLDRHIHLDGEYHGYLAEKMVVSMIENDEDLKLVISEATKSLNARLCLWDHLSHTMN